MLRNLIIAILLIFFTCKISAQTQMDNLSVNIGYSGALPNIMSGHDMTFTKLNSNLILNIVYENKLYKRFEYFLGKGIVRYNDSQIYPVRRMSEIPALMNNMGMDFVHFDRSIEGVAGLNYALPIGNGKYQLKVGMMGLYNIAIRKKTREDEVDFSMKEYMLNFSNTDLLSTLEFRRDRYSIKLGYRLTKLSVLPEVLEGASTSISRKNEPNFRISIGYHFRNESLMRGTINFPKVRQNTI